MQNYERTDRLNKLLVRILAEEVEKIDDERLGLVTVTAVETDRNLSQARVFVTGDGDNDELIEILEEYRGYLQKKIGEQTRLRRIPPLKFVFDETASPADRIEEILRELQKKKANNDHG